MRSYKKVSVLCFLCCAGFFNYISGQETPFVCADYKKKMNTYDGIYHSFDKTLVLISAKEELNIEQIDSDALSPYVLYPVPVENYLNITANGLIGDTIKEVQIYDMQGRVVATVEKNLAANNGIYRLSTSTLTAGFYLVGVFTEDGRRYTYKITKK